MHRISVARGRLVLWLSGLAGPALRCVCPLTHLLDVERAAAASHAQGVRVLVATTEGERSLGLEEKRERRTKVHRQAGKSGSTGNTQQRHASISITPIVANMTERSIQEQQTAS